MFAWCNPRRFACWLIAIILVLYVFSCPALTARAEVGETTRVSVSSEGAEGNKRSLYPSISADGRYVAFFSYATNLVPGDTNVMDVFVHDRQTGQTTRVSVDSAGVQGNASSRYPDISADGRYVAFESEATNLVVGDTNGTYDVFVHDRQTGQTTRVSVDSAGVQGNASSRYPDISADGRYVAFSSDSNNLVAGDTNGTYDVFVHDRQTGQTTRVSVDSAGVQGNASSGGPYISADGWHVVFYSDATNLVPNDTNGAEDVFVHDRQTGQTTRVNVSSAGDQVSGLNYSLGISADGRYVAFESEATNLVPKDTNGVEDVFVHDRQTGQTTRVSVSSSGAQGNDYSGWLSISADGRYVAFNSKATNLVPGDTNDVLDVFVHDRQTGQTTRVSVDSAGVQGNSTCTGTSISADGRYVAFDSSASNLVPGDTNHSGDVFVHEYAGGTDVTQEPFTDQTCVPLSAEVISNSITLIGMSGSEPISITGGEYSINGGAFTPAPGTVRYGDTVRVKIMSSDAYATTVDAIVTIGGITDTFSVTTICGYTVSTSKPAKYKGGTVSLKVLGSDKSCPVPAVVNTSDWFEGLLTKWSNGKGTVKVTVGANIVASERSAEITIGGTPVTITQQAAPCKLSTFTPKKGIIAVSGGSGSFTFSLAQGCGWTAAPDEKGALWLTLDTVSGVGSGEIGYSAAANTSGKPLSGKINVTLTSTSKAKKYSVKQEK